jgi:hypothetical protein
MERLLARLERRFGKYAIENVGVIVAGGMTVATVLSLAVPGFAGLLELDVGMILRGQVWRLFTYLFVPNARSLLWIFLEIYWTWLVATNLENAWGAFKLNAYYALGMLGTTVAAIVTRGGEGSWALNLSLLFAFATVFPDFEILLFFIVPIKVKWLAILSGAYVVFEAVTGTWPARAALIAAFGNYLLFFGPFLLQLARGESSRIRRQTRRDSGPPSSAPQVSGRTCAMCGKRESDGADIRVCSCERCGGPRTLCLEHARNH